MSDGVSGGLDDDIGDGGGIGLLSTVALGVGPTPPAIATSLSWIGFDCIGGEPTSRD